MRQDPCGGCERAQTAGCGVPDWHLLWRGRTRADVLTNAISSCQYLLTTQAQQVGTERRAYVVAVHEEDGEQHGDTVC
jgi:hypothetical protein